MTDIVERLRHHQQMDFYPITNACKEAADEIERLREALQAITRCETLGDGPSIAPQLIARDALEPKP